MNALANHYSGRWWPGEDPPDAYIQTAGVVCAVEVSTLTQQISDGKGGFKPRLSQDTAAIRLIDSLNKGLHSEIPDDVIVILTLAAPVDKTGKVRAFLQERIRTLVAEGRYDSFSEDVFGNEVGIRLVSVETPSEKKVVGAVTNRGSSTNIMVNAQSILEERVLTKATKCGSLNFEGPLWLALINDYWLADASSYHQAALSLYVDHPFSQILLISGGGAVTELPHDSIRLPKPSAR
jgi:hypothetical protein